MEIKLAESIRTFRKERSLTQGAVGRSAGCHRGCRLQMGSRPVHAGTAADRGNGRLLRYVYRCPAGYILKDNRIDATARRLRHCQRVKDLNGLEEAEKALKKYPNSFIIVYRSAMLYQHLAVQTGQRQTAPRPGTAGKSPSASAPEYQPPHQRANALRCYGGNQPGLGG